MEADEIFLADFGLFLLDLLLSNIKYRIKACQKRSTYCKLSLSI